MHSGFEVGRATLGTMITTLLLTYIGCSLFLVVMLTAKRTSLAPILNISMVSAEILRTVAGSIGMVAVAPVTVAIAGVLYHRVYGLPIKTRLRPETEGSSQWRRKE